jgi:hypothetical protein
LHGKRFYSCQPCGAWVGCHPGTVKPLGRLANAELRKAKMHVHAVFDPLWKSGAMSRSEAYRRLSDALGLPASETHVGMFDVETCRRAYRAARAGLERGKAP